MPSVPPWVSRSRLQKQRTWRAVGARPPASSATIQSQIRPSMATESFCWSSCDIGAKSASWIRRPRVVRLIPKSVATWRILSSFRTRSIPNRWSLSRSSRPAIFGGTAAAGPSIPGSRRSRGSGRRQPGAIGCPHRPSFSKLVLSCHHRPGGWTSPRRRRNASPWPR